MPQPAESTRHITRLAPSPTGALHLGNARTFLINWALARQSGWAIVMRIEDLDGPRVKPGAEEEALDTLAWLGIDWDGEPMRQSDDLSRYEAAMGRLAEAGLAYPCALSRKEIEEAASAPHAPERIAEVGGDDPAARRESVYPEALRPPIVPRSFDRGLDEHGEPTNWRFVCPPGEIRFVDAFAGEFADTPGNSIGDFVLWSKRREPSYQLAVTVDDDFQGVTQVVRGDDLLESAARQILIRRALGPPERITYTHLPLVLGPDGRRLAKRHGDTRVRTYRGRGVPPERIIGLIARWCGIASGQRAEAMSAAEFAEALRLDRIPRSPITFTTEDDAWLMHSAR